MRIITQFTEALVTEQMKNEGLERGYNGYDAYLKKETSRKAFLDGMDDDHKAQYSRGSGGELKEEKGRPPKMAAFASSSRFIYTLSARKNTIPGFRFEEQLPTTIGGVANMDGYLERSGQYTFVEAKCREPYSHSAKQTIKRNYRDVYSYLRAQMPRVFGCVMEDIPDGPDGREPQKQMHVVFFCHSRVVAHFDIKQMISHLLGVATKFLSTGKSTITPDLKIQFLYLLYDPSALVMDETDKAEVMAVYGDTCWCAEHYHFEEMFGHIVDFLASRLCPGFDAETLQTLKDSFRFHLCDQYDYMKYFR